MRVSFEKETMTWGKYYEGDKERYRKNKEGEIKGAEKKGEKE